MRRQQEQAIEEPDYSQLTPYDVMRMHNCKTARFLDRETYPSIRPPVSVCSNLNTKIWLADSVEENGCGRPFGMEPDDDIMEVWKQSPNKDSLSCYGLGTILGPEAIAFNTVLINSLKKANGKVQIKKKPKCPNARKKKRCPKTGQKPKGAYVLNRQVLHAKINQMPAIKRKLRPENALSALYCPPPTDPESPFLDDEMHFPLQLALDMVKPAKKPKHGIRKKYKYCEAPLCPLPSNKCTEMEWMKYKRNPLYYEAAFQMEMAEAMDEESEPQPKDYDELYKELIGCFEKGCKELPICCLYGKCCKRRTARKATAAAPARPGIQGCGEFELENADCECGCQCSEETNKSSITIAEPKCRWVEVIQTTEEC